MESPKNKLKSGVKMFIKRREHGLQGPLEQPQTPQRKTRDSQKTMNLTSSYTHHYQGKENFVFCDNSIQIVPVINSLLHGDIIQHKNITCINGKLLNRTFKPTQMYRNYIPKIWYLGPFFMSKC